MRVKSRWKILDFRGGRLTNKGVEKICLMKIQDTELQVVAYIRANPRS